MVLGFIYLHQPAGGSVKPASAETVANNEHSVHQEGKQVFKFAVTNMADVSEEVMLRNNLNGDTLELVSASIKRI